MEEAWQKAWRAGEIARKAIIYWGIWAGFTLLLVLAAAVNAMGDALQTLCMAVGAFFAPPFLLAAMIAGLRSIFIMKNGRALLALVLCLLTIAGYVLVLRRIAAIQC